jgi:purine-cytosine permease-like protein
MSGHVLLFIGKEFSSLLGWLGSSAYLLAYLLLTLNKLKADQKLYHLLNIIGAVGLTLNALFFYDYPNVIVNIAWGLIAAAAIWSIARKKRS